MAINLNVIRKHNERGGGDNLVPRVLSKLQEYTVSVERTLGMRVGEDINFDLL